MSLLFHAYVEIHEVKRLVFDNYQTCQRFPIVAERQGHEPFWNSALGIPALIAKDVNDVLCLCLILKTLFPYCLSIKLNLVVFVSDINFQSVNLKILQIPSMFSSKCFQMAIVAPMIGSLIFRLPTQTSFYLDRAKYFQMPTVAPKPHRSSLVLDCRDMFHSKGSK